MSQHLLGSLFETARMHRISVASLQQQLLLQQQQQSIRSRRCRCPFRRLPNRRHRGVHEASGAAAAFLSISRMLDLGGAPSSSTDRNVSRTVNGSKNCRLQVVAFDVATLTRSLERVQQDAATTAAATATTTTWLPPAAAAASSSDERQAASSSSHSRSSPIILPDASKVQTIASMLGVSLGGSGGRHDRPIQDNLSLLTGETGASSSSSAAAAVTHGTASSAASYASRRDIRSKYAAKLSQKGLGGGIESVQLARQQAEDSMQRGDAGGHWAARKMVAVSTEAPPSVGRPPGGAATAKWMAQTGTGRLLQYLTRRSIKIVLVPSQLTLTEEESTEGDDMRALRRQLQDVVFDALIVPDPGSHPTPDAALRQAVRVLGRESESPSTALLVSSREEHLRAAKSRGWVTCRIRPKNAPRGNVSTHYMVEAVPDVRQVVDEINGISYSAVLNAR